MSDLPLTRGLRLGMRLIDGPAAGAGAPPPDRINVDWRYVTPEFLACLRVPVIAGRAITERDAARRRTPSRSSTRQDVQAATRWSSRWHECRHRLGSQS